MDMNEIRNELQKSYGTGYNDGYSKGYEDGCADRKEGEWISNHNGYWTCSECGLSFLFYAKGNYCPNCGCAMGKENE